MTIFCAQMYLYAQYKSYNHEGMSRKEKSICNLCIY